MSSQCCNLKSAASARDKIPNCTHQVLKQSKRIRGYKSGDGYQDCEPDATILMTFDTFQTPRGSAGPGSTRGARIAIAIPTSPMTVDIFQTLRGSEGPKARAVTRIATPPPSISRIVDTCQTPRGSEGARAATATRIAALTLTIPVTVDTFQKPTLH